MAESSRTQGFTFFELSVVLVILGFVVGGILVGNRMIKDAQRRTVISDFRQFDAAILNFRTKYNALPGDMATAEALWGSDTNCPNTPGNLVQKTPTCNGDGDWQIAHNGVNTNYLYEWYRMWQQLANSGMISDSFSGAGGLSGSREAVLGINVPEAPIELAGYIVTNHTDNVELYPSNSKGHWLYVARPDPVNQGRLVAAVLTGADALAIDSKMDDGLPGRGSVSTLNPNYLSCADNMNPVLARYVTTDNAIRCLLLFRTSF